MNDDSFILTIAKHILAISSHILTAPIYSGLVIMQIEFCPVIALSILIRTSFNIISKSSECTRITRNGYNLAISSYGSRIYRRTRETNNLIRQFFHIPNS